MMNRIVTSPVLWVGLVAGVLIGVAQYVNGGGPLPALLGGAIAIAYALAVTLLGTRSAFSSVLAGRPVDERWEHIDLEASAWTLGISAAVVLGAFVFASASGGPWQPYAFVLGVMGLGYLVSLVIVQRRH